MRVGAGGVGGTGPNTIDVILSFALARILEAAREKG